MVGTVQPNALDGSAKALGSAKTPLIIGYLALAALVGLIGVWSVQAKISGAIIASGVVEVEHNRQVIQHPTGGVISALLVRDGDFVKAGDIILRLDDTVARAELAIISSKLNNLRALKTQFLAERDGKTDIVFDATFIADAKENPDLHDLLLEQINLFHARKLALSQEQMQLETQIQQLRNQIEGLSAQLAATQSQIDLLSIDLANNNVLFEKGLTQASAISTLRRAHAKLVGEGGQLRATIARLKGGISQLEVEKIQLTSTRREKAMQKLRDIAAQEIELMERELTARNTLTHLVIRAPVSGVVHDSQVFARHSVISPASPIMHIIPQDQRRVIFVRIDATHVDEVHIAQQATLRFVAFDQNTLPDISGTVTRISADAFFDERTGRPFYKAELVLNEAAKVDLAGNVLLPGMPVEAFIKTQERSAISYLLGPATVYFRTAFRES